MKVRQRKKPIVLGEQSAFVLAGKLLRNYRGSELYIQSEANQNVKIQFVGRFSGDLSHRNAKVQAD
ncbi:hypothetical protein [Paenibacillus radicis (ex Gao et al. 2016)]|uniref:Uncharacterized protein n=1 Tax=Paenibacillus radicis (ex Gao et al. 2016) TaxID=1737354 RepID=A0A917GQ56_9BACL|nr:hypothetical protein [Paenibacillus radicis (ex Gao et al. 2016)]GGG54042.1 hypothetical protein GCM10010918_03570 [Paenibacillus radicis (ex Gao et al. 2016)]